MSDLHEQMRGLAADVDTLPRPAPGEVRRRADRSRVVGRFLGTAAALALGAVAVAAVARDDAGEVLRVGQPPGDSPTTSAAPLEAAWLPEPWSLRSSQSYTWEAGAASRYRFCGRAFMSSAPIGVSEQLLVHPSGQQAQLIRFTTQGDEAIQLFKFSYASCLVVGRAESIGGPRNIWSYDEVAGASEVVGRALHLTEVSEAQQPATRHDAEAVLDLWSAQASPASGPNSRGSVPS